jgi:ribose transport system substrate-binding protein
MKRNIIGVALVAAAILAGCGPSSESNATSDTSASNATSGAGKTFTIGMSQCNLGEPYRAQMNADIEAAAKDHPELKVVFKDAQNDALAQRSQVEEFIQDKVDLIIISPKESQPLTDPVAKAVDAGIPVVVLDREVLGDKYTCFIGADNKKIGTAAGKWLSEKLGGKGKIVELKGLMTSSPAQDRHAGFMEGIKGSDLDIVFDADTKWLEPNARSEMESALSRIPHIDAVFAHNDPGAHGAYLAAKAAGRDKEMIFIGIDSLPQEGQAYVKQGIEAASFQYPTGGKEAIDTALKILNKQDFPKKIVLDSKFFTKENVDAGGAPIATP